MKHLSNNQYAQLALGVSILVLFAFILIDFPHFKIIGAVIAGIIFAFNWIKKYLKEKKEREEEFDGRDPYEWDGEDYLVMTATAWCPVIALLLNEIWIFHRAIILVCYVVTPKLTVPVALFLVYDHIKKKKQKAILLQQKDEDK